MWERALRENRPVGLDAGGNLVRLYGSATDTFPAVDDDQPRRNRTGWVVLAVVAVFATGCSSLGYDPKGRHFELYCKPDFSAELLMTQMYLCHFTAFDTQAVRELGLI